MLGLLAGQILKKYGFEAMPARDAAIGGTIAYVMAKLEDSNSGAAGLPANGPAVLPPPAPTYV
jgi:hypothetical protein